MRNYINTFVNTFFASLIGATIAGVAMAADDRVRGTIDLRSTSNIVTELPDVAHNFEAVVANVGEVNVDFDSDELNVDTLSASVFEADGRVDFDFNDRFVDGSAAASGFADFEGFTVIRD